MKKITFDLDWGALFPGKPFTVGNTVHHIEPLNIKGIASVSKKIKAIFPMLKEEGIVLTDIENTNFLDLIVKAVPILIENAPEIISDLTQIEVDSLMEFPPQYLIELVTVAVEANIEAKESLEKNFKGLAKMFQKVQTVQTMKDSSD